MSGEDGSGVGISDLTFSVINDSILNDTTVNLDETRKLDNERETYKCTDDNDKEIGSVVGSIQKGSEDEISDDQESLSIIIEMSQILNTKLSPESLRYCLKLVEDGVDYVALAELLKNWRRKKNPQTEFDTQSTKKEWKT